MKYSNEIQIEIDDVYGCPGKCPGCILSANERKNFSPDMDNKTLINSIDKLKKYVKNLKGLEKINLTYGIADHFLMSDNYIENSFKLGSELIRESNLSNPHNGIFYSASMIGKHNNIMSKVELLKKLSLKYNTPAYIIAVLDPKNLLLDSFSETYKKNIIESNKLLGRIDLSINLSNEAIEKISPLQLFTFASENKFDEVTINWVPTEGNISHSYINTETLSKWLIEFDTLISESGEEINTSYRPVILRTIDSLKCKSCDDLSLVENLNNFLPETVMKSIQIDHNGNVFPKYEAVGDIPHSPRLGIKEIGNVNSQIEISDMFFDLTKTKMFILNQLRSTNCIGCEYINYCANSGFHVYNWVLNNIQDKTINNKIQKSIELYGCPHVGKSLFKHYIGKIKDPEL